MLKSDAIEYFGGGRGAAVKVAEALGVSRQAVHLWPEIVPELAAYKLHRISKKKIPLRPEDYESAPAA